MVRNTHAQDLPDDDDYAHIPPRLCILCNTPIHPARLEALPTTNLCIACSRKNPPPPIDPAKLDISQASPINKNGFAPSE
jgi:hypothetical protein